jgi:hypothetical protein
MELSDLLVDDLVGLLEKAVKEGWPVAPGAV